MMTCLALNSVMKIVKINIRMIMVVRKIKERDNNKSTEMNS